MIRTVKSNIFKVLFTIYSQFSSLSNILSQKLHRVTNASIIIVWLFNGTCVFFNRKRSHVPRYNVLSLSNAVSFTSKQSVTHRTGINWLNNNSGSTSPKNMWFNIRKVHKQQLSNENCFNFLSKIVCVWMMNLLS